MDVLSYQLDTAEQFWDELDDIASGDYHSPDTIERALHAYLKFASMYLDAYMISDNDLTRCGINFVKSQLFINNRSYVRRKLIWLLVNKEHNKLEVENKVLIGAVLLIDGKVNNSATFEMMQEEEASEPVITTLWHDRHKSVRLHRILLELLYEMCKIQKLNAKDLMKVKTDFIRFMFDIVEDNDHHDNTDPYNYAAMKVLLALNEQFMIMDVDANNNNDDNDRCFVFENPVFQVLRERDSQTFGENLVFLMNRGIDDTLQLMMLKLLYLVFTTSDTFEYIYFNDLKVLVCVFIRELLDLDFDEEKMRHTYLRVLHPLLQNTLLKKETYKKPELISLLETFTELLTFDQTTVRLAERCLNVGWLEYTKPSPTPSSINSSTAELASTLHHGPESSLPSEINLTVPPPVPPPPRKIKKHNSVSSEVKVASACNNHRPLNNHHQKPPPPPTPRKHRLTHY